MVLRSQPIADRKSCCHLNQLDGGRAKSDDVSVWRNVEGLKGMRQRTMSREGSWLLFKIVERDEDIKVAEDQPEGTGYEDGE